MRHAVFSFVLTNLLGENIHTMKKNTEALVIAGKELELELMRKLSTRLRFVNIMRDKITT
jgi:hypothetical protein